MNYKLSFYLLAPEECFREMIGAVFTVLDCSSFKHLIHKALDIYLAICLFPQNDDKRYGDLNNRTSIEFKLNESKYCESYKEASSKYLPREGSAGGDRRFEWTNLDIEELSMRVKNLLESLARII